MRTYLIPNRWIDAACDPTPPEPAAAPVAPAAPHSTAPPDVTIDTVGDYLAAYHLHVVIAMPDFHSLPIGAVQIEHCEDTQLTYFSRDGAPIGTASWSPPAEEGVEVFARRRARG